MNSQPAADPTKNRFGVHPDVLKLGLVSFLTDLSSELIFSVFAVFFTTVAGASAALLGTIEGLADVSASSLNHIAGWLSDRTGKRKAFVIAGYGFSTLAKAILLISSSIVGLSAFRVIERLGKSFRGPPRDAWLASVAEQGIRGYSFGIHKALDKAGAVLGPLVAYALLSWLGESHETYRMLFWVAVIPAVLSVLVLMAIKEQPAIERHRDNIFAAWHLLSTAFKQYLFCAGLFSLAYFSFGFLLLRAHQMGFTVKQVVLLYALFNVACVLTAPLIGTVGDRVGRQHMIALGYLVYAAMCVGFIFASQPWQIIGLFVLYGIFYAIDEAQGKAFIADLEASRRATAMGIFDFATGLLYFPASLIAGMLWALHPTSAFTAAAVLACAAFLLLLRLQPHRALTS
jgi:MFS family permease